MKLSIVVPCYNEGESLPLLLERFAASVRRPDVEVVLVDNGSTDGTGDVLARLLPRYRFARSVRVEVNQGYGFGVLAGLREARGEFLGWTHADLQTDPADVVEGLRRLEGAPDPSATYVKGRRIGRPLLDSVFTWGMGIFESLYLWTPLWDINAQPNLFHRSFFEGWVEPPHDFSLDLYAVYTARRRRLTLLRFPVRFPERLHGSSHWNVSWRAKWRFIRRTLDFSVKLKRRLSHRANHRAPAEHDCGA